MPTYGVPSALDITQVGFYYLQELIGQKSYKLFSNQSMITKSMITECINKQSKHQQVFNYHNSSEDFFRSDIVGNIGLVEIPGT